MDDLGTNPDIVLKHNVLLSAVGFADLFLIYFCGFLQNTPSSGGSEPHKLDVGAIYRMEFRVVENVAEI